MRFWMALTITTVISSNLLISLSLRADPLKCAAIVSQFANDDSQTAILAGAPLDATEGKGHIWAPSYFRHGSGVSAPLELHRTFDSWSMVVYPNFFKERKGSELDAFKKMVLRSRQEDGAEKETTYDLPSYPPVHWTNFLYLHAGDIIEFPDANRSIQIPYTIQYSPRTEYFYYLLRQKFSDGLNTAYRTSHREAAPTKDTYFSFARSLGWKPTGSIETINFEKLRLLYQEKEEEIRKGKRPPNSLIYPAMLLRKQDDEQNIYFQKPWDPIPFGYEPLSNGFIDDRLERALNALGYFSFGVDSTFTTHDLEGHIRVLLERPQLAQLLESVSSKMLEGMQLVRKTEDGLNALEIKNILNYDGFYERAVVSIVSEQSIAGDSGAIDAFSKITWIPRLGRGWDIQSRLSALYRTEEMRNPGFLIQRAEALYDFYKSHMILTGGVSSDPSVLGAAEIPPAHGSRFFSDLHRAYFLYLASLVKNIKTFPSQAEKSDLLASFETILDFWIHNSPEEILRKIFDDDQEAMALKESALHHQIFSSVTGSTGLYGSYAWLPKGSSAVAVKIRSEFWERAFTDAFRVDALGMDAIKENIRRVSNTIEKALTVWGDNTNSEILTNYGIALAKAYGTLDQDTLQSILTEREAQDSGVFQKIHIRIIGALMP